MRVTRQMVNESARKAGMPEIGGSLLDIVNNSGKTGSGSSKVDKITYKAGKKVAEDYSKTEKAAEGLMNNAKEFALTEEKEDSDRLSETAGKMAASYNETLNSLKKAGTTLEKYYYDELKNAGKDSESLLSAIGITLKKDGTLAVDEKKLKQADTEILKKALGSNSLFGKKAAFLGEHISDNAAKMAESVSGKYNVNGIMNSYRSSKYDWAG